MSVGLTSRQLRRMKPKAPPPKRRWEKSTAGYDLAIECRPFDIEELPELRLRVEMALDTILKGEGTRELWEGMADILNQAVIRAEQIGGGREHLIPQITAAMGGMNRAKDRMKEGKPFLLDGEGRAALTTAIAIFDEILVNSSPKQMMNAAKESQRRMDAGQFHQGR